MSVGQNNPLNIKRIPGKQFLGTIPGTGPFEDYADPKWCYREAAKTILHHYVPGKFTVRNLVNGTDTWPGWAPAKDGNPVDAYVANLVRWTGFSGPLDLPRQFPELLHAMTRQEKGSYPYPDDSPIFDGLALDGLVVEPEKPAAASSPVPAPKPTPEATAPSPSSAAAADLPPEAHEPSPVPEPPPEPAMPPPPVDAPNPFTPSQSTTSSLGVGGAASILLVWVLSLWHVQMTPEQAMAAGVLISSLAGYFAKGGRSIHTQGN
jgi:hypothetical protein